MKSMLTLQEVAIEFNSQEFVLKTQQQIAKDFYPSGVQFSAKFGSDIMVTKELIAEVQNAIEEVVEMNGLQQLMYQIDIPEKVYVALLNDTEFSSQMAEIILRREAYKVFLRSQF
tara:strand:+ start:2118 stop:2462 length:345 start_codon:yes stop_codon:yes gene_type:complete